MIEAKDQGGMKEVLRGNREKTETRNRLHRSFLRRGKSGRRTAGGKQKKEETSIKLCDTDFTITT